MRMFVQQTSLNSVECVDEEEALCLVIHIRRLVYHRSSQNAVQFYTQLI